jgi:Sulfotransferase family
MREFLGIGFGTESQFVIDYYKRLPQYGSLEVDENLNRLIDAILKERWFKRSHKFNAFQATREEIMASVQERSYAGLLDGLFSLFANKIGVQRWGDKTPGYIHQMDVIYKLFPQAQYVYLVRDGRDVALSLRHINFGPKNMYCAAHDWAETVRAGDRFAETLPPSQLLSLRYEDLLADPVATFKQIGSYLQLKNTAELYQLLELELPQKIKHGNSDKWRSAFRRSQLEAYDRIAFHELNKHRYETLVSAAGPPAGPLAHTYWNVLSELGKWKFKDYWKDNFYKLKLRAGRLLSR